MQNNFHSQSLEQIYKNFESSKKGLAAKEVKKKLETTGFNELPEKKEISPLVVFLKQFNSVLVYILVVAAVISLYFDERLDFYIIIVVLVLNAIIGFVQEYRAENAIAGLKKIVITQAKVYRDGVLVKINARELVVGDVLSLEAGDKIPADARLISTQNFSTVESSLTGESFPTGKEVKILPKKTALADRTNMVYMSTYVARGEGRAVVVAIGMATAIGQVAKSISSIKRTKSHFEKKANKLAWQMGAIAVGGATIAFGLGFFVYNFSFVEIFLFSVALLVSAVPEGLPVVLTIVLAVGGYRMSKRAAIIRSLPVTETLGIVTTIITDKTGTITQNSMNAQKVILPGEAEIEVSGQGWDATGEFKQSGEQIVALENKSLKKLLHIATISNNSHVVKDEKQDSYSVIGDPTEAALLVLGKKGGLNRDKLHNKEKILSDLPFNSDLKYRATLVNVGGEEKKAKHQLYLIGAPEELLERCEKVIYNGVNGELTSLRKKEINLAISSLAKNAMRVLAIAYKDVSQKVETAEDHEANKLTLVGLVGVIDPPRQEVKDAIAQARAAGLRVIMATGDHANTALSIADKIGLIVDKKSKHPKVLTEAELSKMSIREFDAAINHTNIFARLTPLTKLKIAERLQKKGEVVAMTGDGVNDAPALKKADIGISMGIIGTDVARDSSHLVLADDNFATIVSAVEEGRIVFRNTQQSSYYLLTTNFAEITTIMAALFMFRSLPLLTIHLLWLNLVTDGFNVVALAMEPGHGEVLKEKPKNAKENILSRNVVPFLVLMTVVMTAATLGVFRFYLPAGIDKARTAAFIIMSLTQIFNVFNMRSLTRSIFKIGWFTNRAAAFSIIVSLLIMLSIVYLPWLQKIFRFTYFGLYDLLIAIIISSFVLWIGEGYKWVKSRA